MKKLMHGLIATVLFGFVGNAQNLREKFLEGKSNHQEVVAAYNKLSDSEQKGLWEEKFNQLLKLNLPNEHHVLLQRLSDDFKDGVTTSPTEDFFITASELAKITPATDFGYMFESLNDYVYTGKFIDNKKLSDDFINDLKNLTPFINLNVSAARGNCSCRWCNGVGTTGSNCIVTEHGCGWFFMQSCTRCVLCLY